VQPDDEATVTQRIVIKIGSSTLTTPQGRVDHAFLHRLADQVAAVREAGFQPIIVTSAAIASGLEALGIAERPSDMPSLQAAASVGQNALTNAYAKAFAPHGIITSTVLLTRRETADRKSYLHARDTLLRLLELGVIPIVNENDTVSVEQIRFGDNDTLAALVACLIQADLLVVLSDIDGLFDKNPRLHADARLIPRVEAIDEELIGYAQGAGTGFGSGGMVTKITAARVLMVAGIEMVICNGRQENVLVDIVEGKERGTRFQAAARPHEITPKKLWIALGDAAKGTLTVDAGAKTALIAKGSSLLCVGIVQAEGPFVADDIVDIKDQAGHLFARGRVAVSYEDIVRACGLSRQGRQGGQEADRPTNGSSGKPVVHRDDLVMFE
jgi:glutamate 5-kinase